MFGSSFKILSYHKNSNTRLYEIRQSLCYEMLVVYLISKQWGSFEIVARCQKLGLINWGQYVSFHLMRVLLFWLIRHKL